MQLGAGMAEQIDDLQIAFLPGGMSRQIGLAAGSP
jgi:hypothetical protein